MTDAKAAGTTAVSALTLGKAGETVKTPEVVRFTGARITVWTEPAVDPEAIRVTFELAANLMLVQRFELDLLLADKAAWVVLADASVTGVFTPCVDHTVTLLRFTWDGDVTVVAIVSGHDILTKSRNGVPQEVWEQVRSNRDWYCWPHGR